MKQIGKITREIEVSLRRLNVFLIFLKTLVILTVVYLLLFIINIQPYLAFIPAVVYFISSLVVQSRLDRLRQVEQKYGSLNEKLRTARDNMHKDGPVVQNLEEEIISNLKNVKLSNFFPFGITILMVFLLLASVTASIYIASQHLKVIKLDDVLTNAVKKLQSSNESEEEPADFTGGKESMMKVGNERMKVEINPVGLDFDFTQEGSQGQYDFGVSFPKEIFISSGAAYENEYTEEQQMLIKRYFETKKQP